jgi:hypothetical protein
MLFTLSVNCITPRSPAHHLWCSFVKPQWSASIRRGAPQFQAADAVPLLQPVCASTLRALSVAVAISASARASARSHAYVESREEYPSTPRGVLACTGAHQRPSNDVASPKGARQVKRWGFSGYAFTICASTAFLAGCGGSQPFGAPSAIPQSRSIAARTERGESWIIPGSSIGALIDGVGGCRCTCVVSYPAGKLVGSLTTSGSVISRESLTKCFKPAWMIAATFTNCLHPGCRCRLRLRFRRANLRSA